VGLKDFEALPVFLSFLLLCVVINQVCILRVCRHVCVSNNYCRATLHVHTCTGTLKRIWGFSFAVPALDDRSLGGMTDALIIKSIEYIVPG
jgi:hypothetical protein